MTVKHFGTHFVYYKSMDSHIGIFLISMFKIHNMKCWKAKYSPSCKYTKI